MVQSKETFPLYELDLEAEKKAKDEIKKRLAAEKKAKEEAKKKEEAEKKRKSTFPNSKLHIDEIKKTVLNEKDLEKRI